MTGNDVGKDHYTAFFDVFALDRAVAEIVTASLTDSGVDGLDYTILSALRISGASTATELVFTYTIENGQTDLDGISIGADSIVLTDATITDTAGTPAVLTHAALAEQLSETRRHRGRHLPSVDGLGIDHGVDLAATVATSTWMAGHLGRPSPSAVVRAVGDTS